MTDNSKSIRLELFAFRNGVIARQLRDAGDEHEIVLGCMLSDINQISRHYEPNAELAKELWSDRKHRECRMIAPMLYPTEQLDEVTAQDWCNEVENTEIADVLCMKLLRYTPFATMLWRQLLAQRRSLTQYTGLRLLLNIIQMGKIEPSPDVKTAIDEVAASAPALLQPILRQLTEEMAEHHRL